MQYILNYKIAQSAIPLEKFSAVCLCVYETQRLTQFFNPIFRQKNKITPTSIDVNYHGDYTRDPIRLISVVVKNSAI